MLVVAIKLGEQLLSWERELDSREGTIVVCEDGLAASERPLGECAWNVTLSASGSRLPGRTTLPGRVPLLPAPNTPSTSTGCWRSAKSFFPYRRWTKRCRR
jgi:hypothetical protein